MHFGDLYRAALRLSRSAPDAEDLVQETCLRAFQTLEQLRHRAYDLTEPFWLSDGPVDLIKPLARHTEYLFVRVRAVGNGQAAGRRRSAKRIRARFNGPGARVARPPAAERERSLG